MSEPITVRKAIERLIAGDIRIPGFQRPFVWEPDRAALLMDSIYKEYPVGSLLLWRTKTILKTEKRLGVFELPPARDDYPVHYVLDGQQRLTSIFSTFQTDLEPSSGDADVWLPIFYDFTADDDAQDARFVALDPGEVSDDYFPLRVFLDPVGFNKAAGTLSAELQEEIVRVQQKFVEALIPVETFESEDRTRVAIVFERINRMGIELDTFQLLTAWTWSDEFDLQEKFVELGEELSDFGFQAVGQDPDLMLRCTAAIMKADPSPSALVNLNGADVRGSFPEIAEAIRKAVDFLRANLNVHTVDLLPYTALLIPLCAYFAQPAAASPTDDEREVLTRWFWRTCFSHRYSGNPQRNIRRDIASAVALAKGEPTNLGNIPLIINDGFFLTNQFNVRTVATKSFILLLALHRPLSFLSGQPIKVEKVLSKLNRSEYHHCYPKARLKKLATREVNVLANFAIISSADNKKISGKAPSEYREIMPTNTDRILERAAIPEALFQDDYGTFLVERAQQLVQWVIGVT
jgi:hypothetical protein